LDNDWFSKDEHLLKLEDFTTYTGPLVVDVSFLTSATSILNNANTKDWHLESDFHWMLGYQIGSEKGK